MYLKKNGLQMEYNFTCKNIFNKIIWYNLTIFSLRDHSAKAVSSDFLELYEISV